MSKRLEILKASLAKKEARFNERLQNHFDTVAQANGQPLNDKRNGRATLNKWDKQSDGKWRVTVQLYGESWRAEKLKDNGERADNKLAVTLNKEQWDNWREQ